MYLIYNSAGAFCVWDVWYFEKSLVMIIFQWLRDMTSEVGDFQAIFV